MRLPALRLPPRALASLSAIALGLLCAPAWGQAAQDLTLTAPDGTPVTIDRDDYGVPHITGENEPAVMFAQGFAVAQDRLFQMEIFWRSAEGRLAYDDMAPVVADLFLGGLEKVKAPLRAAALD